MDCSLSPAIRILPFSITASVAYDSSEYVRDELGRICLRTGLCVLILLLFVLIIYRSWRYMLIILSTLAVNILTALAIYSFAGLQIHIYTLAGMVFSVIAIFFVLPVFVVGRDEK